MMTSITRAPTFVRFANVLITALLRAGLPMGPMWLLTVRGRKTGKPHTTPVALADRDGHHYLFGTFGATNWVRNLRAAGEATITRGWRKDVLIAVELPPEEAMPFLKDVIAPRLKSPIAGFVLRSRFDVPPDAPLADFIVEARRHPVFELRAPATIAASPIAHESASG